MTQQIIQNLIESNPADTPEQILAKYRQYTVVVKRLMSPSTTRVKMGMADLYDWFMESGATGLRKMAQDEMNKENGEFNFMQGHDLYLGPMIEALKAEFPDKAPNLDKLKTDCDAYCNKETHPYQNATLHEVLIVYGGMNYKEVNVLNGGVKITTNSECEAHNPRICIDVEGVKVRIANLGTVQKAGDYAARVICNHAKLYIDDAYEVIV